MPQGKTPGRGSRNASTRTTATPRRSELEALQSRFDGGRTPGWAPADPALFMMPQTPSPLKGKRITRRSSIFFKSSTTLSSKTTLQSRLMPFLKSPRRKSNMKKPVISPGIAAHLPVSPKKTPPRIISSVKTRPRRQDAILSNQHADVEIEKNIRKSSKSPQLSKKSPGNQNQKSAIPQRASRGVKKETVSPGKKTVNKREKSPKKTSLKSRGNTSKSRSPSSKKTPKVINAVVEKPTPSPKKKKEAASSEKKTVNKREKSSRKTHLKRVRDTSKSRSPSNVVLEKQKQTLSAGRQAVKKTSGKRQLTPKMRIIGSISGSPASLKKTKLSSSVMEYAVEEEVYFNVRETTTATPNVLDSQSHAAASKTSPNSTSKKSKPSTNNTPSKHVPDKSGVSKSQPARKTTSKSSSKSQSPNKTLSESTPAKKVAFTPNSIALRRNKMVTETIETPEKARKILGKLPTKTPLKAAKLLGQSFTSPMPQSTDIYSSTRQRHAAKNDEVLTSTPVKTVRKRKNSQPPPVSEIRLRKSGRFGLVEETFSSETHNDSMEVDEVDVSKCEKAIVVEDPESWLRGFFSQCTIL